MCPSRSDKISDLIVAALERPYRCGDWAYARLIRHVVETSFVARIKALLAAEDPLTRLRAQFVLHVVWHPGCAIKQVSWRRWLTSDVDN